MSDLFISYSRKDIAYAKLLHKALKEHDFETWIDWQDIPPSTEWLEEVYTAIEQANTFIFILSASSILSEMCVKEIEHASKNNKRIIPIVINDVEPSKVHSALAAINWIFSRSKDELQPAIASLIEAIQTDYDWVKAHTRLQMRALEWERTDKDISYLLQGTDLQQAENWLAESVDKEPEPTLQQTRYIQSSRQGSAKRQRLLLLSVGAALIVTVVLGILAVINGQRAQQSAYSLATQVVVAEEQKEIAVENARLARIRELTMVSQQEETRYDIALLLGIESFNTIENYQTKDNLFNLARSNPQVRGISSHDKVRVLAVSPDGKTLASGAQDGSIIIWEIANGKLLQKKKMSLGSGAWVRSLDFSSDGKRFVVGTDYEGITLFDAYTFEILKTKETHTDPNTSTFSPDDSILASLGSNKEEDRYIEVWDSVSMTPLYPRITGASGWTGEIIFSPDGRFLAAGFGNLLVVEVSSGQVITDLMKDKTGTVISVAINPDGSILAAAGEDNRITFWETENFEQIGEPFGEASSAIQAIVFSPDGGILAAGSWDTSIRFYNTATRELINELPNLHKGRVYDIAYSSDGKTLFSSSEDGTIIHWDLESIGVAAELFPSVGGNVTVGSLSAYGKTLAVMNEDNDIILYDTFSGQPISDPLQGHSQPIYRIAFSLDGNTLVSVDKYGEINLWDVTTASMINTPQHVYDCSPEFYTNCSDTIFDFSPDGATLASSFCSEQSSIILWDTSSGQPIGEPFATDVRWINDLAFSPDGESLAVGYEGGSCLFDIASRTRLSSPPGGHPDWTNRVAFSPDGDIFASAGGGTIIFWDTAVTQPISEPIPASMDWFNHFRFNPTGDILATASGDGTIMFVDAVNMFPIGDPISLPQSLGGIVGLAFTEDGSALISLQDDGTLLSWDISQASWKENLCDKVGRNFTQEEWAIYFSDEPYRKTCEQWPEGM